MRTETIIGMAALGALLLGPLAAAGAGWALGQEAALLAAGATVALVAVGAVIAFSRR